MLNNSSARCEECIDLELSFSSLGKSLWATRGRISSRVSSGWTQGTSGYSIGMFRVFAHVFDSLSLYELELTRVYIALTT